MVRIKKAVERIPGGLMVVPLLLGALLNTIDQAHLPPIQWALQWLGAPPIDIADPATGEVVGTCYEFLRVGGFASAVFKTGALTLIGVFLVCVGAQMNFRVGLRSLKKGAVIAGTKLGVAVAVGYLVGVLTDPFHGFLGLSMMAVIAAMSNGNGGMYAALTGQYGNRSDVGALSVISLNDGPFFTLMALGLLGQKFPMIAFIAVLVPMAVGFGLGQLDDDIRRFLKPGETLTIPFFAFALGAGMNFAVFLKPEVLAGGLFLGVATVVGTGLAGALMLKLFFERSTLGAIAEASTAGNAVQTPVAVAAAATAAVATAELAAAGSDPATAQAAVAAAKELAENYEGIKNVATAQVSISTMTTAVLCPIAVILWDRLQRRFGIDARQDELPDAVLLLGPTGSGKTPLGEMLQQGGLAHRPCVHFDFGESMRQAVTNDEPDEILSRPDLDFLRNVLDSGALLEDKDFPIAERLIRSFLARHHNDEEPIVVLNGLPRHLGQARGIARVVNVRTLVVLECSRDTVLARIAGNTGGDRTTRVDDDAAAVENKLAIFAERTAPLVAHYRQHGARIRTIEVTAKMTADDMWHILDDSDFSSPA